MLADSPVERIDNNLILDSVNNVVFNDLSNEDVCGGAIYNTKKLPDISINATFNNNSVSSFSSDNAYAYGGALYNGFSVINENIQDAESTIRPASLTIGNNQSQIGYGTAVETAQLADVIGNFTNNSAFATYRAIGGAVYNEGKIANIKGDYTQNNTQSAYSYGGAIANVYGNTAKSMLAQANQGNQGILGLTSDDEGIAPYMVTGNTQAANKTPVVPEITLISGNFTNNYVIGSENAVGGAVYNGGIVNEISGKFNENKAEGKNAYGGAIYSTSNASFNNGSLSLLGSINDTSEDDGISPQMVIQHNPASVTYSIEKISADFIGNSVYGLELASGGAIFNNSVIKDITGNFKNNKVEGNIAHGGAITNGGNGVVESVLHLVQNVDEYEDIGIAPHMTVQPNIPVTNVSQIHNITANFVENSVVGETTAYGGAIANLGIIGEKEADDIVDSADDMLDYSHNNNILQQAGSSMLAQAQRAGDTAAGLVISDKMKDQISGNDSNSKTGTLNGGIVNSSFVGNSAVSKSGKAYGGAIYTTTDLNIIAKDGQTVVFKGNYTESAGERDDNAIFVSSGNLRVPDAEQAVLPLLDSVQPSGNLSSGFEISSADDDLNLVTLTLKMENGGKIAMFDNIDGSLAETERPESGIKDTDLAGEMAEDMIMPLNETAGRGYKTNRAGDDAAGLAASDSTAKKAYSYAVNIVGDDINNTTFYMLNDIRNANVTMENTTINTINNQVHVYNFGGLTINADTNLTADVDLANKAMDRFTASTYGNHSGNLNVSGMNLLSDAKEDKTEIYFAEQGLKDNVTTSVKELNALTPIYKYSVNYDNREDGGYFVFSRGGKNGGNNNFNPAVLAAPVAAQAGATATMGQVFNYAFQNADNFMNIPYLERISIKNANKYALSPTGDATDMGTYSPLFTQNEISSVWVKPYASFESVPLKNGPKVSNITYGTLVGYDTNLIPMKNGWDRVWTGYIGYNGASQRYSGVDSTQNGGLLGGTLTLYKGNFFNATTISAGANVGSNQTMYGHEDITMLLAGIGNKTGYNLEYKEGRLIIQPSLLLSYTFVNTFDYNNAAGVKIKSDPLHAIQIAPGVKIIGNTKNGWQPYIGVNMVWNLLDKSDVTANGVKLPEMSIKPYVQYGVGVQKRFKDNCMAYGQAMIQNGGRNGISLTAGFRWALGKGANDTEKVQGVNKTRVGHSEVQTVRKVVKQLTPDQKTAHKHQNTTRTTAKAIIKQL